METGLSIYFGAMFVYAFAFICFYWTDEKVDAEDLVAITVITAVAWPVTLMCIAGLLFMRGIRQLRGF